MGLTITNVESQAGADDHHVLHSMGDLKASVIEVLADNSWLAAGEVLTPEDFGLSELLYVAPAVKGGFVFTYDYANEKLLAYFADYDAGADGALIVVPDANSDVDGAGVVRLFAIGRP